jgi:hypothetical protein
MNATRRKGAIFMISTIRLENEATPHMPETDVGRLEKFAEMVNDIDGAI